MIDRARLWRCLEAMGLAAWRQELEPVLDARLSSSAHGDMPAWQEVLDQLPAADIDRSRDLLMKLAPWRKGPFHLQGIDIDAEWRSNLKWDRLVNAVEPLAGRKVLDVGCGNGYYALRMSDTGADCVIGIDPTLLYLVQFLAVCRFREAGSACVLPLRLEELPDANGVFDTTFSMGVLYHQRSPLEHLRQLRSTLRPGGQLALETLYLPGDEAFARTPPDRYARMRNVWLLPSIPELETWLDRTGFRDIEFVDRSVTSTDEQRSTPWMRFESLAEALDPRDPGLTVEGWPAPRRVLAIAKAP